MAGRVSLALHTTHSVMPGFMPGIHDFLCKQDVDGRDKPGHDGQLMSLSK